MRIQIYLHGSKETCCNAGERAGLKDTALKMFMYAATEHCIEYEVNEETGEATAVKIDNRSIV